MFCVNNGIRVIEDEYHLISICLLYQHLRSTFLQAIVRGHSINALYYVISCNNKYANIDLFNYAYHTLDNILNEL